jgi:DNA polymerase-3 subunit delta'
VLLNCPEENAPCLSCPVCLRILGRAHRDFFYLDGADGSIKIEEVRALRSVIGEAPREAKKRVIVLAEAQGLTEAAANAMLKSLEEPRPGTLFALLAPQRERLLPTLVSRSWVLTLAWPDAHDGARSEEDRLWEDALGSFARSGTGLFERTGARGSMDAAAAQSALLVCRRALAEALAGRAEEGRQGLVRFFAALSDERRRMADEAMAEAQESLGYMANPALVVEWLATRLHLLAGRR